MGEPGQRWAGRERPEEFRPLHTTGPASNLQWKSLFIPKDEDLRVRTEDLYSRAFTAATSLANRLGSTGSPAIPWFCRSQRYLDSEQIQVCYGRASNRRSNALVEDDSTRSLLFYDDWTKVYG